MERTGVDPAAVEDVVFGCVDTIGPQAGDIARTAWLAAGLPEGVPGTTVDRQCGSSQQAVHFAAQGVMSGTQDLVVAGGVQNMSAIPISAAMTTPGVILGTAAYMAPEQAKGTPVDRRADVWALGAVLFEMLTGRRAFHGENTTDTIVAVLSKDPDWSSLPTETPAPIERMLRRCLQKDRRKRLDSAAAVRLEIDDVLSAARKLPSERRFATGAADRLGEFSSAFQQFMLLLAAFYGDANSSELVSRQRLEAAFAGRPDPFPRGIEQHPDPTEIIALWSSVRPLAQQRLPQELVNTIESFLSHFASYHALHLKSGARQADLSKAS